MPGWAASAAPRGTSQAGDDVERPVGKADLPREARNVQDRERSVFRGLHDAGIPGCERRTDGATENLHRVVPRDDMARDAVRHPLDTDEMRPEVGNHVAVQLVGGAPVILEIARQRGRIGSRLAQRLAVVARLDGRQRIGVRFHGRGELHEEAAAFRGGQAAPGTLCGLAGRRHCRADIFCRAGGDRREGLPVDGREHVENGAMAGLYDPRRR